MNDKPTCCQKCIQAFEELYGEGYCERCEAFICCDNYKQRAYLNDEKELLCCDQCLEELVL